MSRLVIAIILSLYGVTLYCGPAPALVTSAEAKAAYEWKLVAPAGSGCFAPKCAPGQFPMATMPVTGLDGKLYLVGDHSVWTSQDGIKWDLPQPKTDWGERYGQRFAYFRGKLWMLGGMQAWDDFRHDVWSSSDGSTWQQVVKKGPWQPRRGHAALVFDDRLWIIGGSLSSGRRDRTPTEFLNDVWSSVDGVNWTQATSGAPWSAREVSIALVFDDRIWVIGGRGLNDVWSTRDGRRWVRQTPDADFGPREGSAGAVFDGKMWVYGGVEKNDVWHSTDGAKWTRAFDAAPWSPRSTVYSTVYKDRLLLFSGKTGRADTQQGEIWAMSKRTE